jgi:transposase
MMGRLDQDQGQLFYSFCLDEVVPGDHRVREIAAVLDLSWVHAELAPHYSALGRPSIDPVLMIRMLILGYVFAIRSERAICREVQVNPAYRWFCGLSIEDRIPDHSAFTRARNERFRDSDILRRVFERGVDPATGNFVMPVQSYLVRTRHHTILIDTCIGCRKSSDKVDEWRGLTDESWLTKLTVAGVQPEAVDYVFCTHFHLDHCGWNTRLTDGR